MVFIPLYPGDSSDSEYWEDMLEEHRERTINITNALTEKNNLPLILKTVFEESVYSFCRSYSQVLLWKSVYDPRDDIVDLKAILRDAQNYFTVDGEFDDFAWTKFVVLDPIYPITSRFCLAAKYWLENETAVLLSELKNDALLLFNDNYNLNDFLNGMVPIVILRISQLENKVDELLEQEQAEIAGSFYEIGFKAAAVCGYEYAVRYFWEKIEEWEKIMENESLFHLIYEHVNENTAVFLYLQLSKEQKQKFFDWCADPVSFFTPLLFSPRIQGEHVFEIIKFLYKLPIDEYLSVLTKIAKSRHIFPSHREEAFKVLWSNLSSDKRGKVLEDRPSIIVILIEEKLFDMVKYIIKGLSLEQKENIFFITFMANSLEIKERNVCASNIFTIKKNRTRSNSC